MGLILANTLQKVATYADDLSDLRIRKIKRVVLKILH